MFLFVFIITTIFYNIFYNKNFTLSKCCLEDIKININKSHTPLCLTNNVFLFGQKETISAASTPSSSITSYNPVIFHFIGAILSSIFCEKDNFNITKQLFSILNIYLFVLVVILSINKKIVI